jgi:hypothetical protein
MDVKWRYITSKVEDLTAQILVTSDAVRENGIRITCSFAELLKIAKQYDSVPLTAKVADLIYEQADIILNPVPMNILKNTAAEHSKKIDDQLAKYNYNYFDDKLVANVGKYWLIGKQLTKDKSINYGWFIKTNSNNWRGIGLFPSATLNGVKVIQCLATAHNWFHNKDYSQTVNFMYRKVFINDKEMDIFDVLQNNKYTPLISHTGVLPSNVIDLIKY